VSLDRRQDCRKKLPEDFPVFLYPRELTDGGPPIRGNAVDLTMGGIGILLAEAIDQDLHSEVWAVEFEVPDNNGRLLPVRLHALITHGRPQGQDVHYGLKFTDISSPQATSARAALRQFLLSDLRELWKGNPLLQAPSVAAR
jgi:c-di-GMP-binding flagellar brake protein YcgR